MDSVPKQPQPPQSMVPTPQEVGVSSVVSEPANSSPQMAAVSSDGVPPSRFKNLLSRFSSRTLIGVLVALVVISLGVWAAKTFWLDRASTPTKIKEIVWWSTQFDEADLAQVLKDYEAKSGTHVRYIKQAKEDYQDRLVAALARGEGPDVFEIHNTWAMVLEKYLDILPPEVLDKTTYAGTFYPVAVRDLSRGESFVGIPLEIDGLGLFYNESELLSLEVVPPDEWNKFRQLAFDLTSRDLNKRVTRAGVALGETNNVDQWQDVLGLMLTQNRADLSYPQGEEAVNAFSFFLSFSQSGGSWDETLPTSTQAFAEGRTLFYFGPAWRAREIKEMNPDLTFKVVPVPQLATTTVDPTPITWASYRVQAVSSTSKAKVLSWEFLKYLSSREVLNTLATGRFAPSRVDLAELFSQDGVYGAYVRQAPYSYSWYLTSYTNDGAKGINTQVSSKYALSLVDYEDKSQKQVVFDALGASLAEILAKYPSRK